jgi:phosphonate transport system substrate-binding protein
MKTRLFTKGMKRAVSMTTLLWLLAASQLWAEPLNLGIVDESPSKSIQRFGPLMDYLRTKGMETGRVVVTRNLEEMVEKFSSGKVDFIFESAYAALTLKEKTGAVPILIREKGGVKEYNSVVFVRNDSPIQSLTELAGKVIAFEDPGSTSSFMLPRTLLVQAGMTLTESRKPMEGKVAYYFSNDDDNTIAQVRAGRADAGGIKKAALENHSDFRILQPESTYLPRHVVLVRKGIAADRLRSELLNMKKEADAQKVLEQIKTPTGFSEFDDDPSTYFDTHVRRALGLPVVADR